MANLSTPQVKHLTVVVPDHSTPEDHQRQLMALYPVIKGLRSGAPYIDKVHLVDESLALAINFRETQSETLKQAHERWVMFVIATQTHTSLSLVQFKQQRKKPDKVMIGNYADKFHMLTGDYREYRKETLTDVVFRKCDQSLNLSNF